MNDDSTSAFLIQGYRELSHHKTLVLQSLARELYAAADVLTEAGLPENAKLLRMMAQRATDAANTGLPYHESER